MAGAVDAARLNLRAAEGGCVLPVKVVPGSSRDRLAGVLGDMLKVSVSAAPEKGKANAAVAKLLAAALQIDARQVQLASGPTNPRKEFLIIGLDADTVRARLASAG
jgi:uncharacterized protein (TIGR00251 family)